MTPLHWASVGAHKEIAELLIAAGSRKNKIDRSRATPLETAKVQLKRLQDGIDHFGNECATHAPFQPHPLATPPSCDPRVKHPPGGGSSANLPHTLARALRYKGTDKAKQLSKFSQYVEYMESLPGIKKKE